jgi:hypothetical protein
MGFLPSPAAHYVSSTTSRCDLYARDEVMFYVTEHHETSHLGES